MFGVLGILGWFASFLPVVRVHGAVLDIRESACSGPNPSCENCCGLACCSPTQACDDAHHRCYTPEPPPLPPAITVPPVIEIASYPPCSWNVQPCGTFYQILGHGFSQGGKVWITMYDIADEWTRWADEILSDNDGGTEGAVINVVTGFTDCTNDANTPNVRWVLMQAMDERSDLKSNIVEIPIFCDTV